MEIIVSDFTPASSVGDLTTLVKSTFDPLGRFVMVAPIKPLATELPGRVLETKALPDGSVWLNTTPVAALGPRLNTVTM